MEVSQKLNQSFHSTTPASKKRIFSKTDSNLIGAGDSPAKKRPAKGSSAPQSPVTTPRKQKSKFTISSDLIPSVSRIPMRLERTASLESLKSQFTDLTLDDETEVLKQLPTSPTLKITTTQSNQSPDSRIFKKPYPVVVSSKLNRYQKPRKSNTMHELRQSPMKSISSDKEYAAKFIEYETSNPSSTTESSQSSDRYKFLAYKTFAFMLRQRLSCVKTERNGLVDLLKSHKTVNIKTKTQLHVINALYHVERKLHDEARQDGRQLKNQMLDMEKTVLSLQLDLKVEKDRALRDAENQVVQVNLLELKLKVKCDELDQARKDNRFLIAQRQGMEVDFQKRFKKQEEMLQSLNQQLLEESKEIDRLELIVESLENKALQLENYRYANYLQAQQIEALQEKVEQIQRESTIGYKLKSIINMGWKEDKPWYLYYCMSAVFYMNLRPLML